MRGGLVRGASKNESYADVFLRHRALSKCSNFSDDLNILDRSESAFSLWIIEQLVKHI